MGQIKVCIVGVGNCASSLVQGVSYCAEEGEQAVGVIHPLIGGYRPEDIRFVAAFDIDRRKIGLDLSKAIYAKPNCTTVFNPRVPEQGVTVRMGALLDGVSPHMENYGEDYRFEPADAPQPDKAEVVAALRESGAEVMINFLPVGSETAARFYAECALEAGLGFVNGMPVFIASDPEWAGRFAERGLPIVGDDFKAQLGATITHRTLAQLFDRRGVTLDRTYQLNVGGNTDFLNMLNTERLSSKRRSKTEAVQSVAGERLDERNIRIGPSDYVPWLDDNKVAYIRMEGRLFGGVPMNVELRLSVEDSPNAAAVAVDAIRCVKLALDQGVAGVLEGPSAFLCKHPPQQLPDAEAGSRMDGFAEGSAKP